MYFTCTILWASQVALVIENPPANAGDTRDTGSIRGLEPWKRKRQLTPVFLPGEFRGQRNGLRSMGLRRVRHSCGTEHMYHTVCLLCIYYRRVFTTTKSLVSISRHTVDPLYPFTFPSLPFPSGNQYSALYICVFLWFG